jgi:hypothetical protein
MYVNKKILEKMNTTEGKKQFIDNYESNMYAGWNVDGERVIVMNEQGSGMEIWTKHKEKLNWYEVVGYDENGIQEYVSYKSVRDTEAK